MNSESYWSYREAGAFYQDPDEPEERERMTRCVCGAFLPRTPTFEGGMLEVERDYGDFNPWTGEWVPAVEVVEDWFEPTTDCKRCGRIWTEEEMWR